MTIELTTLMMELNRDMTEKCSVSDDKSTVLPSPDKSPSDKKTYKVIRLPNNLTALLVSDGPELYQAEDFHDVSNAASADHPASKNIKSDRFAACALSINVGGYSEPDKIPGLAHFLEHMVFLGSEKYPIENEFNDFVQKHGGWTNAFTSGEQTTFYVECNVRYLFKAMDMFSHFFISPLLKKDSMVREREAVDTEFNHALSYDFARINQLLGSLASDENPGSKFIWGNAKTLKDSVSEDELYESLRSFHQQYYSANLMTVAIMAKLPIDVLENYAFECFSGVSNHRVSRPTYSITKPLFVREKFHRMYYVASVSNVTDLILTWQMPPLTRLYRTKSHNLISWLVAHEGKGSLLSYLKSKLWALELIGGINYDADYNNSLYSLFVVTISLSEDGFAHLTDVITATFSYLKLVQASLPQRRLYDEVKTLKDLTFQFQEEQDPASFVCYAVENMHQYPSKDYLTGPELYFEYKPEEVTDLLQYLSPETVNIMVLAKEFKDSVILDQVEPWFETKYGSVAITQEELTIWQNVEPYPEFKLPRENPFISSDFQIIPPTGGEGEFPVQIHGDEFVELWYKLDTTFKLPMASINLHFASPTIVGTSTSTLMLELFISMFNYILMEDSYQANLAQLCYSIAVSSENGIQLKVNGFSHKLPTFLATITEYLKNFTEHFNIDMFNTLKMEMKKRLRSSLLNQGFVVEDLHWTLLREPYINTSQMYNILPQIQANEFVTFIENFFTHSYVKCLIQGNISSEKAIEVCTNTIKVLNLKPIDRDDLPHMRIRRIPVGQRCLLMKTFNKMDRNSATSNYFQWGEANIMLDIKLQFLVKLMVEKAFNVLRTQEQLGYNVCCWSRNFCGVIGFAIVVFSKTSKFETTYVEERISRFLDDFSQLLTDYKIDEFDKEREALIKARSVAFDNLNQEVDCNFTEIVSGEYVFDRRRKEIDYLRKIYLPDIQAMLASIMAKDSDRNRRISIQVIGNKADDSQLDESSMEDQSFDFQFLDGEKNLSSYYIKDIEDFKSNLFLYPELKIIDGEVPTVE